MNEIFGVNLTQWITNEWFENEKIICQIVVITDIFDQNGDRVSTNDKIAIFVVQTKGDFS